MTPKELWDRIKAIDEQLDVSHAHTGQLCKERAFLMQRWKEVYEQEQGEAA